MLLLSQLRTETERVRAGLLKKGFAQPQLVDQIISLDEQRRKTQGEADGLAARMNAASKSIGALLANGKKEEAEAAKKEVSGYKEKSKSIAEQLQSLEQQQNDLLVLLPNLPHESVPAGRTPEENETVRTGGEKGPVAGSPHWDLITEYGLIDFERGTKITGAGFPVYTGMGARLQRALISYFLDYNAAAGYAEVQPPYLVNEASAYGTGQLPR